MTRRRTVYNNGEPVLQIEQVTGPAASLGYRSNTVAAREGRTATSAAGRTHQSVSRPGLVKLSRQYMRDNPIYKGMIEQMVTRTVGNGFKLQVRGASATQGEKVEKLWNDYFHRPEVRGLLSGAELSRMIMRELVVTGDIAILKTSKATVQVFESEQICGRSMLDTGIKTDDLDRPVSFQLCPWTASGARVIRSQGKEYKAEEVLFLSNTERPSEIRGVPAAQSVFTMLERINDVCESEAVAWQLLSRMALIVEKEGAATESNLVSKADPNKDQSNTQGDLTTRLSTLDYALIFWAEKGETIKGVERNLPGADFEKSLRTFLRLLGLPLGLPLELILLDWTRSNYSQSRAVLEQAYENFLQWQEKLVDFFYEPLLQWKLKQWISSGLVKNVDKLVSNWITPSFPWIDQVKETKAQGDKVAKSFVTHGHVCKSLNMDRKDVVEIRKIEMIDAIKKVQEIEKLTGVLVPWQPLAGLPVPSSSTPPAGALGLDNDDDDEGKGSDDE